MSLSSNIKNAIKIHLDELVVAETLALVLEDDFSKSFLSRNISAYPVAILTTPSVDGDILTNRQNIRSYTFEIIIILKGEDVTSTTQVEELLDAIIDKFDNDPTLGGAADAGMIPSTTSPAPVSSQDKSFIIFSVFITAKAVKDLTF